MVESHTDFDVKEFRDSRLFFAAYSGATSALAWISTVAWGWGPFGLIVFGVHAIWSAQRLLTRRPRLSITRDGILNNNFWYSPGLIPWANIRDVRRTPLGIIKVDLVDSAAFLDRLPPLSMLAAFKPMLLWVCTLH